MLKKREFKHTNKRNEREHGVTTTKNQGLQERIRSAHHWQLNWERAIYSTTEIWTIWIKNKTNLKWTSDIEWHQRNTNRTKSRFNYPYQITAAQKFTKKSLKLHQDNQMTKIHHPIKDYQINLQIFKYSWNSYQQ